MTIKTDAKVGESYVFVSDTPERPFKLDAITVRGKYMFRDAAGCKRTIAPDVFERMRGDGSAKRIDPTGITKLGVLPRAIHPRVFLDPDDRMLSRNEMLQREKDARTLDQARTLYFYVKRLSETSRVSRHVPVLQRFINDNYPDAQADGLFWKPHPTSLIRVLAKHGGKPQGITLAAIHDQRNQHEPAGRWGAVVAKMLAKTIAFFYSAREPPYTKLEAEAYFFARLIKLNERRARSGAEQLELPCPQTVANWIDKAATRENLERRLGKDETRRMIRGRGRSVEAQRALDIVLMDNTQVDVWAVVRSPDGKIIDIVKPWLTLAVDVYSRMIVGAHLSPDQASLTSAFECLKQIVRRKDHLIRLFPDYPEASDCWGRVGTLILDNGLDFASLSFRVACEYAGIGLHFAPVRTPEYKGIVERTFGTLNTCLWHRLPGGTPGTPQERSRQGKDPEAHAEFTIDELNSKMWATIVTILGMSPHSGTDMAPARRFFESLRAHGRPTVDDIAAFDAILGRTRRCLLTAEGIRLENHTFHDPVLTGGLLEDMLSEAEKRGQRSAGSSSSVHVWALLNSDDCSYARVYNTKRKEVVVLPNWNPDIQPMTSFKEAALQKAHRDAENEVYFSKNDRWTAIDRERRSREVPKERRKGSRRLKAKPTAPVGGFRLAKGTTLAERTATPSASGARPVEIPKGMAVQERTDNLIPPKDPPRGRRQSRGRPRKNNAIPAPVPVESAPVTDTLPPIRESMFRISDPEEFMANLRGGK